MQAVLACSITCTTAELQASIKLWICIVETYLEAYTLAPESRHLHSPVWVRSFPTYKEYTIYF